MFKVFVTPKGEATDKYDFDEEMIVFGRVQGNQIVLPRGNVSKRHATIELRDGGFFLTDLQSTNGSYLNGRKIQSPVQIYSDDKIYLGDFIIHLDGHIALKRKGAREPQSDLLISDDDIVEEVEDISAPDFTPKAKPPKRRPSTVTYPIMDEKKPPPRLKIPLPSVEKNKIDDFADAVELEKPANSTGELVEKLISRTVDQVKRVDMGNLPSKLDAGTAGTVRIILLKTAEDMLKSGELKVARNISTAVAKAFYSIVDLDPVTTWLEDPKVMAIRILGNTKIYLSGENGWEKANHGFSDVDDLLRIINCLSSGIIVSEKTSNISTYYLEEGFLVHSIAPGDMTANPYLFIDKTTRRMLPEEQTFRIESKHLSILIKAVEKRKNICVSGFSFSARYKVFNAIKKLINKDDFCVCVESPYMAFDDNSNIVHLHPGSSQPKDSGFEYYLNDALKLEPKYLCICGIDLLDTVCVLGFASNAKGILAEMPLNYDKNLKEEFGALPQKNSVITPSETKILTNKAFDYIVIAKAAGPGQVTLEIIEV